MVVWKSGMDSLIPEALDRRLINHSELKIAPTSLQFACESLQNRPEMAENRSKSVDFARFCSKVTQDRFEIHSTFEIGSKSAQNTELGTKLGHRQVIR